MYKNSLSLHYVFNITSLRNQQIFILSSFVLPYTFHGEIMRFADNDGKNKRKCLDVLLFFSTFAINC